jgi:hypothetical protein
MRWEPVSESSREELRNLIESAKSRGDDALAVILQGVELYISLGREFDLLESMRSFEREIRPAVEGTPSALDLHRLYNLDGYSSSRE